MGRCSKAFRFRTPSSIMIVGPSGSGKTHFTERLLCNNLDLFQSPPKAIHYCYGAWQEGFQRMKRCGIKFHEGIPELSDLTKWFPKGGVLVMDDLMDEGGNDKRVLDLFTKHSHHRNITVLYLSQEHFSQRSLHRGFQESQGWIGYSQFVIAILSIQLERGVTSFSTGDIASFWLHAIGSSSCVIR